MGNIYKTFFLIIYSGSFVSSRSSFLNSPKYNYDIKWKPLNAENDKEGAITNRVLYPSIDQFVDSINDISTDLKDKIEDTARIVAKTGLLQDRSAML